eukprot:3990523-Karenia_brevis.AAC.1
MNCKRVGEYEKGVLRSVLAGAVWHGHALYKAGVITEDVCQFCGSNVSEDLEHLWWSCPAWEHIRSRHRNEWFSFMSCWPSCFKLFGIMPLDHPSFLHLAMGAADTDEFGTEAQIEYEACEEQAWHCELLVGGLIVIYTDGACRHNDDVRLRKAGYGAFWAIGHPHNFALPVEGDIQTNQRAELLAVLAVLEREGRPLEIRTDSKYVYDGCTRK